MTENITKKLLQHWEDSAQKLYQRYESALKSLRDRGKTEKRKLEESYFSRVNALAGESAVELQNTLEAMADRGYTGGGETVQMTIAAGANRARRMSELDRALAEERGALSDRIAQEESKLTETALEKIDELREKGLKAALSQAQKQEKSSEQTTGGTVVTPSLPAHSFVDALVKQNTTYQKEKGGNVLDRKNLAKSLDAIMRDKTLNLSYRYQIYLYGKSMGYLG